MSARAPAKVLLILISAVLGLALVGCQSGSTAGPVTSTVTNVQPSFVTATVSITDTIAGPNVTVMKTATKTLPQVTKVATTTKPAPAPVTVTVTRTVTADPVTMVATPADAPTTTADIRKFWPVANDAGTGNLPFPDGVEGQHLYNTWTVQRNVFGEPWMDVDGPNGNRFPSTMNGCDSQTFLVRWRALSDGVSLDAQYVGAGGDTHKFFTASDGWMSLDGCETPQLRLHSDNPNELAGSVVTVEQFSAVG